MANIGLLLLRLVFGGTMLLVHGLPKFNNFATYATQFPDPLGVGSSVSLTLCIFAELICSAFVVLGLFSRMALIPLMFTMGVAFFVIHGMDPFEKKEIALLFLSAYGTLFLTGPGEYSLQHIFKISAGRFSWFLK